MNAWNNKLELNFEPICVFIRRFLTLNALYKIKAWSEINLQLFQEAALEELHAHDLLDANIHISQLDSFFLGPLSNFMNFLGKALYKHLL